MASYYDERLSAEKLRRCYEIAPPRIQRYLEKEIDHVLKAIEPGDLVAELGCGYGRVLKRLATKASAVMGIDTSYASLLLAQGTLSGMKDYHLIKMDATRLGLRSRIFDMVVCIQNGISAFHVDPLNLVRECIRVTKSGGLVLLSSYSEKFWKDRLEWFRIQSECGLIGEIDWKATGGDEIICKDGFKASTFSPAKFTSLISQFNVAFRICEVDESSIFCEIMV